MKQPQTSKIICGSTFLFYWFKQYLFFSIKEITDGRVVRAGLSVT